MVQPFNIIFFNCYSKITISSNIVCTIYKEKDGKQNSNEANRSKIQTKQNIFPFSTSKSENFIQSTIVYGLLAKDDTTSNKLLQ